jgi:hypothetical protein
MKLFHIGLHKTGTTSLQRNLFRCAGLPYFGVDGEGDWISDRVSWLRYLLAGEGELPTREASFVFSEEGLLLRAGMQGAGALARRIASVDDACVLVTVREPSALLKSAYYQSLSLRGSALGYLGAHRSFPPPTTRFQGFPEWWVRQKDTPDISLAGLLHYKQLYEQISAALGKERVCFLPIEWLRDSPRRYARTLASLGFPQHPIDDFLLSPPQNTNEGKELKHLRPIAFRVFERSRMPRTHWLERLARKQVLGPAVVKWMYSGAAESAGAPSPELFAEISQYYEAQWRFALSVAESGNAKTK